MKTVSIVALISIFCVFGSVLFAEETVPLELSGFADTSYFYDVTVEEGSFGFDEFELDIIGQLSDFTLFRVDINFREVDSGGDDGVLSFDEIIEQGYVSLECPQFPGHTFSFGKFNAPIGFESLDGPDMYHYSHALVFDLGIPTNVTGLRYETSISDVATIDAYLVNGWDKNSENNSESTFGFRVGFSPVPMFTIGFAGLYGSESERGSEDRIVLDIDGSLKPVDKLLIGFEINQGTERDAVGDGEDGNWRGWLLMANYNCSDHLAVAARYDWFDDEDGLRTGLIQTLMSYTLTMTVAMNDRAFFLFDYRHDHSDEEVFIDESGEATDSSVALAFEFLYTFSGSIR